MGKFYGQMLPFSQPAFGRQSRCQFFKLMQFSAQPATGAFVLCRRTDNAASTSPGYHLQFPAGRYKLSDRINNELLYLYSAFVPSGTFSKFRHKHKCSTVAGYRFFQSLCLCLSPKNQLSRAFAPKKLSGNVD